VGRWRFARSRSGCEKVRGQATVVLADLPLEKPPRTHKAMPKEWLRGTWKSVAVDGCVSPRWRGGGRRVAGVVQAPYNGPPPHVVGSPTSCSQAYCFSGHYSRRSWGGGTQNHCLALDNRGHVQQKRGWWWTGPGFRVQASQGSSVQVGVAHPSQKHASTLLRAGATAPLHFVC